MNISLDEFNNIQAAFYDSAVALDNSFNSDWEDSVHDSFADYIAVYNQIVSEITELVESMIALEADLMSIDVDKIDEESSNIIMEIDALLWDRSKLA